jgi:hypothetical protein
MISSSIVALSVCNKIPYCYSSGTDHCSVWYVWWHLCQLRNDNWYKLLFRKPAQDISYHSRYSKQWLKVVQKNISHVPLEASEVLSTARGGRKSTAHPVHGESEKLDLSSRQCTCMSGYSVLQPSWSPSKWHVSKMKHVCDIWNPHLSHSPHDVQYSRSRQWSSSP